MSNKSCDNIVAVSEKKPSIVIVNNNMKLGGVQKSLLDLLVEIEPLYDITLCLLYPQGEYMDKIPSGVKVMSCSSAYKYFGMSQAESKKSVKDFFVRSSLAVISRVLGRLFATKLISLFSKKLDGEYDVAISFMHDAGKRSFYGGCNDFVLSKISAKKKITFLHCDYKQCGCNFAKSNRIYDGFDRIAACSEGCRKTFLAVLPEHAHKTSTVTNCHDFDNILKMADENTVSYDNSAVNVIMVARLGAEKGIDRALAALKYAKDHGANAHLHIVGGGNLQGELEALSRELGISECAFFYGAQANPYRYMKNADLMLIASYHEAAPLVIDEAISLGVPVLSTATTSSDDMILDRECGWVCENEQSAINEALLRVVSNIDALQRMKESVLDKRLVNNDVARKQFKEIIEN